MKKESFIIPMNRSEHSGAVREITKGEGKMEKWGYGIAKFLIPITISFFVYSVPALAKESQEMVGGSVEVERPPVMTKGIVSYKVKQGDSMSSIATAFKIPLKDLLTANPHIKNYNKLSIGQDVYLP